ncbi:hypothetical protein D3C72_1923020 [compost metagenome]
MGAQAVYRIVRDNDRLIDRFIRNNAQHRPENFFLGDPHCGIYLGENCRSGVETLFITRHSSWPAANEFCALTQASLDHGLYAIELGLVGNGTEHRSFRSRITHDDRIGGFGCQQFDFRQPVLRNDHSCRGAARLSDVAER